jgi:hypothetical protein
MSSFDYVVIDTCVFIFLFLGYFYFVFSRVFLIDSRVVCILSFSSSSNNYIGSYECVFNKLLYVPISLVVATVYTPPPDVNYLFTG